jgi:predicted DNA-binding ribbon-helix-helix protein
MSKGKNLVRNKPNSFVPTRVIGIRAEQFFWESVEEVAMRQNLSRNGLIIKVMSEYIMNYGSSGK